MEYMSEILKQAKPFPKGVDASIVPAKGTIFVRMRSTPKNASDLAIVIWLIILLVFGAIEVALHPIRDFVYLVMERTDVDFDIRRVIYIFVWCLSGFLIAIPIKFFMRRFRVRLEINRGALVIRRVLRKSLTIQLDSSHEESISNQTTNLSDAIDTKIRSVESSLREDERVWLCNLVQQAIKSC